MIVSVSAILVVRKNHNNYLTEALKSVYAQSYLPKEVILIFSRDTPINIKKIKKKYSDIIVCRQKNVSLSSGRNFALRKSKCKYIAFLDYDDIWPIKRIEYLYRVITNNKSLYVFGKMLQFHIKNKKKIFLKKNLSSNFNCSLINKNLFYKIGFLDIRAEISEMLWRKKLFKKKISTKKIYKNVLYRRIHYNNWTRDKKKIFKQYIRTILLMKN
jgi:glycosyltransferase involved in cell wall biosynthesis